MSKLTLLIDGDIIAFQASASAEHPVNWGEGLWTLHAYEQDVIKIIDDKMERIREDLKGTDLIVALSWETNFRYTIYPEYKHNRVGKRTPMLRQFAKNYIMENYKTYLRPDLEGDDVLGILATSPYIIKGDKILVTIDKDMKGIPCNYYDFNHPENGVITIDEPNANYFHMLQTLMGDQCDGYIGCRGIGQKSAEKILAEAEDYTYQAMWPLVVRAYESKGYEEFDALVMARVANICRREHYNFKKKEVILWKPPATE